MIKRRGLKKHLIYIADLNKPFQVGAQLVTQTENHKRLKKAF